MHNSVNTKHKLKTILFIIDNQQVMINVAFPLSANNS